MYMGEFRIWFEENSLQKLINSLELQYPGVQLSAWENSSRIELAMIKVPKEIQGQGIGSKIIQFIKDYAQSVQKPIVLRPDPEKGKKAALNRFYTRQDFVNNKGKNIDYSLSSPTSKTMYWKSGPGR